MPALSLPPRFWIVLAVVFVVVLAWRVARRWWADYKRDLRHGWDALKGRNEG